MAQRVQIIIEADSSNAQRVIDSLNKNLGNIGVAALKPTVDGINQLSAAMQQAVKTSDLFVRSGYRLTLGLSAPIIAAAGYIAKMGAELQSARTAFEVLSGSVETANTHLAELQNFAKNSPFPFTSLLQLSRQLQAAGFEADKVVPLLRNVGNALAATGNIQSVERIINQLVRIENLGRVTLRELNPLARAGIPVFQELADAIRKPGEAADETTRRLRILLKSGLLPGPEFIQLFSAAQAVRFPQGLEKATETLKGQFQILLNTVEIAAAQLGEAFAPAVTSIIKVLLPLINKIGELAETIVALPGPVKLAVTLFTLLLAVIGPLVLAVGSLYRAFVSVQLLFATLTRNISTNTAAVIANTTVSQVAAKTKLQEAAATEVLATAVKHETQARVAANESTLAEQLSLFNITKRLRDEKGHFIKDAEKIASPAEQLKPPFSTAPSDILEITKKDALATTEAVAAAEVAATAATSRYTALIATATKLLGVLGAIAVVAYEAYNVFKQFTQAIASLDRISDTLDKLGIGFQAFKAGIQVAAEEIPRTILSSFKSLGGLNSLLTPVVSNFAQYGQLAGGGFLRNLELYLNPLAILQTFNDALTLIDAALRKFEDAHKGANLLASILPADLAAKIRAAIASNTDAQNAQKEAEDKANKATLKAAEDKFNAQLRANQAAAEAARITQFVEEGQRKAREDRIAAEGRELGGLQGLNRELSEYIDKLTTHVVKFPGEEQSREIHFKLTAPEQLDVYKRFLAEVRQLADKNQKEIAQEINKTEQEAFKVRETQAQDFAQSQVSRLESLAKAELISALEVAEQRKSIELAASKERLDIQLKALRAGTQQSLRELDEEQTKLLGRTPDEAKKFEATLLANAAALAGIDEQERAIYLTMANQVSAVLKQYEVRKDIKKLAGDVQEKDLTYKQALAAYNIEKTRIEALNALYKEAHDKRIELANEAALEAVAFERKTLETRRQLQLSYLDAIQPISISQAIEIEKQKFGVQEDFLKRTTDATLREFDTRNAEVRRKVEEEATNRYGNTIARDNALADHDKKTAAERIRIQSETSDAIAEAAYKSQLEQLKIVRDNALSIFDTIKKANESMLDQLFSRSKSFGEVLGNAIKGAFLSTFKSIISSNISAQLTKLITGQNVTFQEATLGTGPFAGIGRALSRAGLGKPIIGSSLPPAPPQSQGISFQQANIISDRLTDIYTVLAATKDQPLNPPDVPLRTVNDAELAKLEQLRAQFADNSLLNVQLDPGGLVPVVIKRMEGNALGAGKGIIATPATEEDAEMLRQLKQAAVVKTEEIKKLPLLQDQVDAFNRSNQLSLGGLGYGLFGTAIPSPQQLKDYFAGPGVTTGPTKPQYIPTVPATTNVIESIKDSASQIGKGLSHFFGGGPTQIPNIQPQAIREVIGQPTEAGFFDKLASTFKFTFSNLIKPTEISRYSQVPILRYSTPPIGQPFNLAAYNSTDKLINIYGNTLEHQRAALHEEIHAILDINQANQSKLVEAIPTEFRDLADTVLKSQYHGAYPTQQLRTQDTLARLFSNEGHSLDLTDKRSTEIVDSLLTQLRSGALNVNANISGSALADKLEQVYTAARTQGLIPQAQRETTQITEAPPVIPTPAPPLSPVSNLPNLPGPSGITNYLTSTFGGGLLSGAGAIGLTAIANEFTTSERVKDKVKSVYGVVLDTRFAESIADTINKKYGGNLDYGVRTPEIRQAVQLYALYNRQKFGAGGNALSLSQRVKDLFSTFAAPAAAASSPGILSSLRRVFNGSGTTSGGGIASLTGPSGVIATPPFVAGPAFTPAQQATVQQYLASTFAGPQAEAVAPIPGLLGIGMTASGQLAQITGSSPTGESLGIPISTGATGGVSGLPTGQAGAGLAGTIFPGFGGGGKLAAGLYGLASTAGAGLLQAGLSSKTLAGPVQGIQSVIGAGLLGAAAAHFGLLGGLAQSAGFLGPGLGIGAGAGLLAFGLKKGGYTGLGLDIGGGALAGASIGTLIAPGIGTAIGAGVGATAGAIAGLIRIFAPTLWQKVKDRAKSIYGIDITDRIARSIADIINQKYGGNVDFGMRTPEVRQYLELYALSTGQNAKGLVAHAQASQFANIGGTSSALPTYFNGAPVYPGDTQSRGGLPILQNGTYYTTTPPLAAGTVPAGSGPGGQMSISLQLDPNATQQILAGNATDAIQAQPRLISQAALSGQRASSARREGAAAMLNPAFTIS